MVRKLLLPLAAVGCFLFTSYHLARTHQSPPDREPLSRPARSPYADVVAGAGILEARTENIKVGSPLPGVVSEVAVAVGQRVDAGDLLFRLDDRQLRAEMKVREAQLAVAAAALSRFEQLPRPEEMPASEAKVRRAEAQMISEVDVVERREKLVKHGAVPEEELVQRRQMLAAAKEAHRQAQAEDELLKAGGWEFDKVASRADVLRARSMVEQTRTELDRLEIRAPVAGHVLQVDVRPGEYVGTPPGQPLVVLGDLDRLHVRVDIDEQDIPRFHRGAVGKAFCAAPPANHWRWSSCASSPTCSPSCRSAAVPWNASTPACCKSSTRLIRAWKTPLPGNRSTCFSMRLRARLRRLPSRNRRWRLATLRQELRSAELTRRVV